MAMITSGSVKEIVDVALAAARKGAEEATSELAQNGMLTDGNSQQVAAQGNLIREAVKTAVKGVILQLAQGIVGRLKRIFADRAIELAETDGTASIAEANDVFTAGIYVTKREKPAKATKKTLLAVYQMIKDGKYAELFGGFGENLERLRFMQAQVVAIVRDHRDILRTDGYGTFMLYTVDDMPVRADKSNLRVARVSLDGGGRPDVFENSFSDGDIWDAKYERRVVVPQL